MVTESFCTVLITGSGGTALSLTLRLVPHPVILLSKERLHTGATYYAQGGIVAVSAPEDSLQTSIQDTLDARAGLCDTACVNFVI